jgi:cysteine synthase A
MPHTLGQPLIPAIATENFTELQHRNDGRVRGILGEYAPVPERTLAYDLDRTELFERVESLTGNTPLIHIEDIAGSSILAKVESQNPTENHYDRVFPATIKKLEADGVITPGDELVEVTSGSGGRAFAWATRVLGYKAHIIVPPELPKARLQDMINFGAKLEVTEPGYMREVSKVYVERMAELEQQCYEIIKHKTPDYTVFTATKDGRRLCFVNHSANELSVKGFDSIGDEIYTQMPEGKEVDFVVSVMGNGTSTTALSRTLRKHYPNIRIVGLEDQRSPYYFEQKYPGEYEKLFGHPLEFSQHDMFGSSAPGVKLKYGNADTVDEVRLTDPEERDRAQEAYNRHRPNYEKIGNSSAASLVAARHLAEDHPGSTIVIIFYDKADQYGSRPLTATRMKFLYDRPRPHGIPKYGWRQQRVGSIALMPQTIDQAYNQ